MYIESMKSLVLALIGPFFVVLSPCVSWGQIPSRPVPKVSESEYRLLSDYIVATFTGDKGEDRVGHRVSKIMIVNKTQSDLDDDQALDLETDKPLSWKAIRAYLHKEFPKLQAASLNSFREMNTQPAPFQHSFHLSVPYDLVDKTEVDSIFNKGGWWTDYYKKYPNSQGILSLSRVGFSPDGNQAVFYASNGCGGKCGTGTYVVMKRVDSGWKVAKEILTWIS
jgi:hypothetical protein